MTSPNVTFTSQGRLVEHNGVIAAAEIDGKPVLCHFLRETLLRLNPKARFSDSVDLFRDQRDCLAQYVATKAARTGVTGEFFHLLPSDLPSNESALAVA